MFAYKDVDCLEKVHISQADRGTDYFCGENHPVIPKKGEKNRWHFAHKTKVDCSMKTSGGMTEWHSGWQDHFQPNLREIRIVRDGKIHIADIKLKSNNERVIEFQHSGITLETVQDRETFYDNMIWVFDRNQNNWKIQWKYGKFALINGLNIPNTSKPTYVTLSHGTICMILNRRGPDYLVSIIASTVFIKNIASADELISLPVQMGYEDYQSLSLRYKNLPLKRLLTLDDVSETDKKPELITECGEPIGIKYGDEKVYMIELKTSLEMFMLSGKVIK